MAFFKSPHADATSVSVEGKTFDIVNGFVEVLEEDFVEAEKGLFSLIERTLINLCGFKLESDEDVGSAIQSASAAAAVKGEADERAGLLATIKAWGLKIDARKNLEWVRERYEEFVSQGHIRPGETPPAAVAQVEMQPAAPAASEVQSDAPVAEANGAAA